MMKETRWLLFTTAALLVLVAQTAAVAPFKKVSIATTTASTTTTTTASTPSTEAPTAEGEEKHDNATITAKNSKLTGIPQIDWVWDPNLPRELRGYNLSQYPFFSTVPPPEDIHFKCDNLHDGFYASIEFKCQVYHHCVYGIRHDFLCANFTAFDQKTFICHFVSDVDCEGSMKYWNRNDNLYMATTTTTTSTTTTEPPPTPRRRPIQRPLRPLRRPVNRRPAADDYYYDEEEYDDDYYEERLNRRRKQRPRQRKPIVEYEDDYEEKRSFANDEEEKPRKSSSRDRFREEEEVENDYDSFPEKRPKQERSKPTSKTTSSAPERRKIGARKPGTILARPKADERRSFSDDRPSYAAGKEKSKPVPQPAVEDSEEPVDAPPPRRLVGRRRINEKRTSPLPSTAAALDDIEEDHLADGQQDEVAEEGEHSEAKPTTPKPLEEFVTPKAPSPVYARPRAPPRIARPVPVNAKKKFQYPVVKASGGTTAAPAVAADEDYYEDDYADSRVAGGHPRRRIADAEDDDLPPVSRRRQHKDAVPVAPRKPTRSGLRKPVTDKKPLPVEDDEYADSVSAERYDSRNAPPPPAPRKRPYAAGRNRAKQRGNAADDVDFVDDDYEERPVQRPATRSRPKAGAGRKSGTIAKKNTRPPPVLDVDEDVEEEAYEAERPSRQRPTASSQRNRKKPANGRLRQPAPTVATPAHSDETVESDAVEEDDEDAHVPAAPSKTAGRSPSVRVVKRPFLPSRGGSPYLPRGLQPVGIAKSKSSSFNAHTTDSTPLDMGSTISGVRLLEHGAPILRDSGVSEQLNPLGLRTTLPPRSAIPVSPTLPEPPTKVNLDELYENDYDVTLNDALDPTLKPLSPHHQLQHQNQHQQHDQHDNHEHSINYASAYSSAPAANTAYSSNLNSAASAPSASLVVIGANGGENAQQQHPSQLQQQSQQQQRFSHSPNAYLSSKPHQTLSHSPSLSSSSSSSQQSQSPQAYLNPAYQQALLKQQQYAQQQQSSNHQQQHQIQQHQQQQQQQQQHHHALNNYNSDSYFSSTDIRRRAIVAPSAARTSRTDYRGGGAGGGSSDTAINTRIAQHFYDDFDY